MTWEGCTLEEPWFFDHTCTTLADLEPMNCKRSKWEISRPGSKETCTQFNDIISCEMGECKNVSRIYTCTFQAYCTLIENNRRKLEFSMSYVIDT